MKAFLTLMLSSAAIAICPAADKAPKLPRGAVSAENYAEAKSAAAAEKKLIVYMWSELDSTCPKCEAGTEAAMKAYKSNKDVVLVFGQGKDTNHAPASLRGPLMEAIGKVGNSIPIVMIVDPSNEKLLAAACYKQFEQDDRVWKKIQKQAQTATGAGKDDKS